jgi:thiosulfate reductase cytochrome b subunit
MSAPASLPTEPEPVAGTFVRRHRLSTRLWHWGNVLVVFVLLTSGLTIFNAHPMLYWGDYGANHDRAFFQIGSAAGEGYVRAGDLRVETTGVLGRWEDAEGVTRQRAFPGWATLPSSYNLALARRWHLSFAWLFALGTAGYLLWSLANRHLTRDLLPAPRELAPRHLWHEVKDHARLRFPGGAAAARYNSLQKLSYVTVLLLLLPLLVLTGLTMSPAMNAAWPWLLDVFGGRQSARSLHFIAATGIVLFVLVHLAMVVLAGPINEVRSMVTGRFRLPPVRLPPVQLKERAQ